MSALDDSLHIGVFLNLPADVLRSILSVLPPGTLAACTCTCQAVRAEIKACDWLWKQQCINSWKVWSPLTYADAEAGRCTWRALFVGRKLVRGFASWTAKLLNGEHAGN